MRGRGKDLVRAHSTSVSRTSASEVSRGPREFHRGLRLDPGLTLPLGIPPRVLRFFDQVRQTAKPASPAATPTPHTSQTTGHTRQCGERLVELSLLRLPNALGEVLSRLCAVASDATVDTATTRHNQWPRIAYRAVAGKASSPDWRLP